MTTRTFVDKNGNEWSWNETPEVLKALKELHDETKINDKTTNVG
jgi:hypothetical protein